MKAGGNSLCTQKFDFTLLLNHLCIRHSSQNCFALPPILVSHQLAIIDILPNSEKNTQAVPGVREREEMIRQQDRWMEFSWGREEEAAVVLASSLPVAANSLSLSPIPEFGKLVSPSSAAAASTHPREQSINAIVLVVRLSSSSSSSRS